MCCEIQLLLLMLLQLLVAVVVVVVVMVDGFLVRRAEDGWMDG